MNQLLFNTIEFSEILIVIGRTVIIFFVAFLVLRFIGRRHFSHLTYIDVLLIIAMGSAVGDVMIYGESIVHLLAAVVAIIVVGLIVKIFDELASHFSVIHAFVIGGPVVLMERGKIVESALRKNDMNKEELLVLLREQGIHDIKKVKKVYLEPDGEISVLFKKRYR